MTACRRSVCLADSPSGAAFLPAGPAAPLYIRAETDSALDEAWRLYERDELPPWGSLLAGSQSRGRGRMGRPWKSPPGHLYAALRLPEEPTFQAPAGAIRLAALLALALEELGQPVGLKWPNDLLRAGRKAAGILLESRGRALLAGLGFNLGQAPEGVAREPGAPAAGAFSFSEPPQQLWPKILSLAYKRYQSLAPRDRPGRLLDEAARRLVWRGRAVMVKNASVSPKEAFPGPGELQGRVAGLGAEGSLRLILDNKAWPLVEVWSGSVFLLEPQTGYEG